YLFPYQRLVVSNILEKRDQIVILPTGAGKSLCFSLPALLLDGPTLIIFPLLALMADQARRLEETGRDVAIIRGGQKPEERDRIWNDIEAGKVTYILSNPETLIQEKTAARLKSLGISHMVIDEAHTVSEWGDSFRPSYLQLAEIRKNAEIPQVTAFTATASEYVLKRIREIVFEDSNPNLVQAVPDRPNISYSVHPALSKDYEIRAQVETAKRPAIIFCRSRTATELTARMLRRQLNEDDIRFYHAGLEREEKTAVEEWFFESNNGILTATCAYGIG
ncbi:MAG: ATP-dependent DNA helicase RecQ, partial [Spirochaetales bacterium]|nr:ATP-dependent DNA helicase RecQ [Spirochaetales bacterium]